MSLFSLSPDLNPAEHLWASIKATARDSIGDKEIKSADELWNEINQVYNKLSNNRQFFIDLVQSMPNRLQSVRNAQGNHSKY